MIDKHLASWLHRTQIHEVWHGEPLGQLQHLCARHCHPNGTWVAMGGSESGRWLVAQPAQDVPARLDDLDVCCVHYLLVFSQQSSAVTLGRARQHQARCQDEGHG